MLQCHDHRRPRVRAWLVVSFLLSGVGGCRDQVGPQTVDHGVAVFGVDGVVRAERSVQLSYWLVFKEPAVLPFCDRSLMVDVEVFVDGQWSMTQSVCPLEGATEERVPSGDTLRGRVVVPGPGGNPVRIVASGSVGGLAVSLRSSEARVPR